MDPTSVVDFPDQQYPASGELSGGGPVQKCFQERQLSGNPQICREKDHMSIARQPIVTPIWAINHGRQFRGI